jgi:hypothetical protein
MDDFFLSSGFHFSPQNTLFRRNQFSTLFFSMKVAESRKIVLVNCIIDFKDAQVWLKSFRLNLNAYGVVMEFFKHLLKNQEDHHNFVGIEI